MSRSRVEIAEPQTGLSGASGELGETLPAQACGQARRACDLLGLISSDPRKLDPRREIQEEARKSFRTEGPRGAFAGTTLGFQHPAVKCRKLRIAAGGVRIVGKVAIRKDIDVPREVQLARKPDAFDLHHASLDRIHRAFEDLQRRPQSPHAHPHLMKGARVFGAFEQFRIAGNLPQAGADNLAKGVFGGGLASNSGRLGAQRRSALVTRQPVAALGLAPEAGDQQRLGRKLTCKTE